MYWIKKFTLGWIHASIVRNDGLSDLYPRRRRRFGWFFHRSKNGFVFTLSIRPIYFNFDVLR